MAQTYKMKIKICAEAQISKCTRKNHPIYVKTVKIQRGI